LQVIRAFQKDKGLLHGKDYKKINEARAMDERRQPHPKDALKSEDAGY
jgi:hypothetical protein